MTWEQTTERVLKELDIQDQLLAAMRREVQDFEEELERQLRQQRQRSRFWEERRKEA